ncbi:peptidylprolyl isomerase [Sphingomonas sp.]|uniref:peptidylprolyl isomerase n=1 Tax=Sphingomonas sp. TaxID=28214 RepID=UPI002DD67C4F|nr:SurA N-terminal domain-containing protein [Sphingomonas sp.]
MLSGIRTAINSTVGKIVALGVLVVIAIAFAAGDITNVRGSNQASGGAAVSIGRTGVGEAEIRQDVQTAFSGVRQQQPTLDMATFVTQGGFDQVLDRTINGLALEAFGEKVGLAASKRAVDGEIASIPAFQGFDGKFSQTAYDTVLKQQQLTDRGLRTDIARDMIARQLLAPTAGAAQVPAQLALPYASLLLERRQGSVGFIPVSALGTGTAPTDQELQAYFTRQRARYTIPERRVVRYAIIRAAEIAEGAKPTAAEIAKAYAENSARFAAREKRSITQIVIADQGAANQLAAKVKGGTAMADAARAAGLEAAVIPASEKAALATQTSAGIADAAFAAERGAVVGPARSPLGWHVVRVDSVEAIPAKTLEQATPELTAELGKVKGQEALSALHDKLDDAISNRATFDEVIADSKLTAQATKPLVAGGIDPDAPAQPDPLVALMTQAAFASEPGDSPQLVQVDADGSFAVVGIGEVRPAAPPPLGTIRQRVAQDLVIDRNLRAARALAVAAVAKIDKGTPIATAMQQTNLKLPPLQSLNATRAELARPGGQLPPPIALMFSMASKRAKMLEAPNRGGWYVVYLDAIQEGNARGNAALIASTRQGLGSVSGREFTEQFTAAVRGEVGVKRNDAVLSKLRSDLAGSGAAN